MSVIVTTRIKKDLLKVIDKAAKAEATDRSTVIRKLLKRMRSIENAC